MSGRVYYFPRKVEVYLVLPYADDGTKLKTLSSEFRQFLIARSSLDVSEDQYQTLQKYSEYLAITQAIADRLTPSGVFQIIAGRLIPRNVFSPSSVGALVDALVRGFESNQNLLSAIRDVPMQVIMTTSANKFNTTDVGVNPAWRGALWHLVNAGGWVKGITKSMQDDISACVLDSLDGIKALTPQSGCYFNEGHPDELDWQQTFFGTNYARLLSIKNQYDPTHLEMKKRFE